LSILLAVRTITIEQEYLCLLSAMLMRGIRAPYIEPGQEFLNGGIVAGQKLGRHCSCFGVRVDDS
jgi:hypothetical protein